MKKVWDQYSYAIILISFSFILALVLAQSSPSNEENKYISVTVEEGDSLWKLSEQYAHKHNLSPEQFINWVKKTNEVSEFIYAGDELIIPIMKSDMLITDVASSDH